MTNEKSYPLPYKIRSNSVVDQWNPNPISPIPSEAIKLADELYHLVEGLIKEKGDLSIVGRQGPWRIKEYQIEVGYSGPKAVTRLLFLRFANQEIKFDLQVKGWVFIVIEEKTIYAQRILSRTPYPTNKDSDNYEGDIHFFLDIGRWLLDVAKSNHKNIGSYIEESVSKNSRDTFESYSRSRTVPVAVFSRLEAEELEDFHFQPPDNTVVSSGRHRRVFRPVGLALGIWCVTLTLFLTIDSNTVLLKVLGVGVGISAITLGYILLRSRK